MTLDKNRIKLNITKLIRELFIEDNPKKMIFEKKESWIT